MKKRITCITLALLMLMSILSGCAGTTADQQPPASPAGSEPAPASSEPAGQTDETPEAVAKVSYPLFDSLHEFTFLVSFPPQITAVTEVADIVAYKQAENATNVRLNATVCIPETMTEKFNIMAGSGTLPDIVSGGVRMYTKGADAAVNDELFVDLLPYMEEFAPNYFAFYESDELFKKNATSDSGYVPTFRAKSITNFDGGLIRADWLENLNLEIPETYDELHNVLLAFKNEYGCKNAIGVPPTLFSNDGFLCGGFGFNAGGFGEGTNDTPYTVIDGKVQATILMDGFKEYLVMLNTWYNEGLFDDSFLSLTGFGQIYDNWIFTNDCGFWSGNADALGANYAARSEDPNFKVAAVREVTKTPGEMIHVGMNYAEDNQDTWCVAANCKEIEKCISYIDWFYSPEGSMICNWGLQGEAFDYDAGGNPYFTELITNNESLPVFAAKGVYTSFEVPYVMDMRKVTAIYTEQVQIDSFEYWGSNRDRDYVYYGTLNETESEEYSTLMGDIATLANEQYMKFVMNQASFETDWDAFITQLEALGIDRCIQLKQDAYDRYVAR